MVYLEVWWLSPLQFSLFPVLLDFLPLHRIPTKYIYSPMLPLKYGTPVQPWRTEEAFAYKQLNKGCNI